MDKTLNDLVMAEKVDFVEINEDVLNACMTTCMASVNGDCDSNKK